MKSMIYAVLGAAFLGLGMPLLGAWLRRNTPSGANEMLTLVANGREMPWHLFLYWLASTYGSCLLAVWGVIAGLANAATKKKS